MEAAEEQQLDAWIGLSLFRGVRHRGGLVARQLTDTRRIEAVSHILRTHVSREREHGIVSANDGEPIALSLIVANQRHRTQATAASWVEVRKTAGTEHPIAGLRLGVQVRLAFADARSVVGVIASS
jgi:hypothetical protein